MKIEIEVFFPASLIQNKSIIRTANNWGKERGLKYRGSSFFLDKPLWLLKFCF